MKLRKTTLLLMIFALAMGGIVYWMEQTKSPMGQVEQGAGEVIFRFTAEQVQGLTIITDDPENPVILERIENLENPQEQWQIAGTEPKIANDAYVLFLLDKLVTTTSDRTLSASASQLVDYGLDQPDAQVEIRLKDGTTHRLIVGNIDFSNNFLYAQVDPAPAPSESNSVLLVPVNFLQAVDRPLSEWEQVEAPPEESSPEGVPAPAETPSPTVP